MQERLQYEKNPKKNMPKVTIIMPSLNVVKYIRPCIESVISQTLKELEILIIDAGSSDGTLEILQEYALIDKRICIIHSKKKSYGYQVNLGIELAAGEYIGVVETDDMVCGDAYETLYTIASQTNAEYVKGTFEKFVDLGNGTQWNDAMGTPLSQANMINKIISPQSMPELFLRDIYLWSGVYKKEFITQIRLNETAGAAYQDVGFLFQTMHLAKRAVYLDKAVYQYRQDNGASSSFNKNGFHYLVEEYAYIRQFLCNVSDSWKKAYYCRMIDQTIARFRNMAVSGKMWGETEGDISILRKQLIYACENKIVNQTDLEPEKWHQLSLLLQGTKELYEEYIKIFQQKTRTINNMFKVIGERKVVIFGCGRYGKYFHALLMNKCAENAVAFCDNNSMLWQTEIQGLRVLSPKNAVEQFPKSIYVIANLRNADAIKTQLIQMGIGEKNICVWQENPDMLLLRM